MKLNQFDEAITWCNDGLEVSFDDMHNILLDLYNKIQGNGLNVITVAVNLRGNVKVKSASEPSGPSVGSLSRFPCHQGVGSTKRLGVTPGWREAP